MSRHPVPVLSFNVLTKHFICIVLGCDTNLSYTHHQSILSMCSQYVVICSPTLLYPVYNIDMRENKKEGQRREGKQNIHVRNFHMYRP